MLFKRILKIIFICAFIIAPVTMFSQENSKATKAQKKAEKKKAERAEKARKADIKGKKRHYKLQDKKTRKRMKKHRKRVDQHNPGERPGFFKRLFRKKHYYIFIPFKEENEVLIYKA